MNYNFKFARGDVVLIAEDNNTGFSNVGNSIAEIWSEQDMNDGCSNPDFNAYRVYVHTGMQAGCKIWVYEKDLKLLATR